MNYPCLSQTDEIKRQLTATRRGAIRIWGDWFGRPYDNVHKAVGASVDGACLRIDFNEGETLEVWDPIDIEISPSTFRISHATRVRWSWFRYGHPHTPENRYQREYEVKGESVVASTNVDWSSVKRNPQPQLDLPAVELL